MLAHGANIEQKSIFGFTALHYASLLNDYEIIEMIIKKNANINLRDEFGRTAYFCSKNHSKLQSYLNKLYANKFITPSLPGGSHEFRKSIIYKYI